MDKGSLPRPLKLLTRRQDLSKLLTFFRALSEGLAAAFADSAERVPTTKDDRPGVYTRGTMRRWFMDQAFCRAAEKAGFTVTKGTNSSHTWSFPIIRLGAFSLTLGIVDRPYSASAPRLRSRGRYVRDLTVRNKALNPAPRLFAGRADKVPSVIPDGTFGGLVVVEPSMWVPDSPSYIGLLVPSPDLRKTYFRCSLDYLIRHLRDEVAATKRPKRAAPQRKQLGLRAKPGKKP